MRKLKVNNRALGSMLVYLFIVVFAICGFQHVVANTFVFTQAPLIHIIAPPDIQSIFARPETGETLSINMVPTLIGNVIGRVFISSIYIYIESDEINRGSKMDVKIILANEDGAPEMDHTL